MKLDWWTLMLQTINVVILIWILQRFLFKPLQAIIAQRQQKAQQLTTAAEESKQKAEQERATLAQERRTLATEREQALAGAQADAKKASETILEQAATEAGRRANAGREALQRERAEAESALQNRASALAGDIARQLLKRLPAASWNRHFILEACGKLSRLTPAESDLLKHADSESAIQVLSADALSGDDMEQLRTALRVALGREAVLEFAVDPNLLAGVELRFRHFLIRNHWAADIEQLTEQPQHDPAQLS